MEAMGIDEAIEIVPHLLTSGRTIQLSMHKGYAFWKFAGDRQWEPVSGYSICATLKARIEILYPGTGSPNKCVITNSAIIDGKRLSFRILKQAVAKYAELHPGRKMVNRKYETDTTLDWPGELRHEFR